LLQRLDILVEPIPLLLDFQGKDLGNKDGQLSLLIFGLPDKTYIVDTVALSAEIPRLAPILQSRKLRKVVWDGRLGYSELWHGFGIRLENVLDLQLVYLHGKYDVTQRNGIPLSGKMTAIKDKKLLSPAGVEIEQKSTSQLTMLTKDAVVSISSKKHGKLVRYHNPISTFQLPK
jgi:hypothetical protein